MGVTIIANPTDPYHLTAVQASMGAVFIQHIVKTTTEDSTGWKINGNYQVADIFYEDLLNYRQYNYQQDIISITDSA